VVRKHDGMVKSRQLNVEEECAIDMVWVAIGAELALLVVLGASRARLGFCGVFHALALHLLDLSEHHLVQPFVLGDLAHLMLLHKPDQPFQLCLSFDLLFTDDNRFIDSTSPASSLWLLPRCRGVRKPISGFMPPDTTLLPSSPQCGIFIIERYCCTAEWDVMAGVSSVRVDRRKIPKCDG
jgi:hypothetical protein